MSTALGQRKPEKLEKGKEKGKAGGKGTKTVSPILDGPIESDTSRPLDSEEIQALAIRFDELEKLHQDKNGKKLTEQQKSFIVKKTKTGPQKQPIQVAKIAPQQPVQEQLISSGIRFDSSGNVLSYSILGTINDYVTELPDIEAAELCTTGNDKKTAEDIPEIGTYDKKTKQRTGSPDGGTRALKNWKFRMDERRQVMKNMSRIFTERWQLLTRPVLCGGRPIIFTLRGVTIEEDIHRQTRINIDKMLLHKEAESIVRKVVSNILDNVRTPERARSPVGFYMTEQEQFQQNNPDLYFDYEIVEQIKKLYEQVVPEYEEQKWNLSIDTLRDKILSFDEDNPNKQIFLEQLNQAIHQLTLQPILPSEQTTYLVCYDIMNQFVDSFVDQMIIVHQKLQIDEPSSESYPDIDLNGYEFESWKKFFEYTKQQENEKRLKSAVGGATKDKKAPPPSKLERGKSPKRSPAPSQAPSAVGKRGTVSGSISQMSKRPSFISPAKPDKERFQLTPQQLDERFKLTQQAYLPIYSLLCHTFDRLEQALDDLSEKSPSNNENTLYTQLATTIQNQSLNVLDILKDELIRNVTSIDVNSFF
ncbi:unnamed protein product [Rotaria sordida]|uniref:MYCBP-associated protein n=1 Tax=Rotaria sordida TaxID=392033 RepID=A0A814VHN9_9BILA|nr:unnamed protein product [Rotaria sordida]